MKLVTAASKPRPGGHPSDLERTRIVLFSRRWGQKSGPGEMLHTPDYESCVVSVRAGESGAAEGPVACRLKGRTA